MKALTPLQFASLLMDTLDRRAAGESQIVAARNACIESGTTTDWSLPIIATLNDSSAAATAWAQRLTREHCDRIAAELEQPHAS